MTYDKIDPNDTIFTRFNYGEHQELLINTELICEHCGVKKLGRYMYIKFVDNICHWLCPKCYLVDRLINAETS